MYLFYLTKTVRPRLGPCKTASSYLEPYSDNDAIRTS